MGSALHLRHSGHFAIDSSVFLHITYCLNGKGYRRFGGRVEMTEEMFQEEYKNHSFYWLQVHIIVTNYD